MTVLSAAVAVVGAVSLLNLVLLYGVIRRLRTQAAQPPGAIGAPLPGMGLRPDVGSFTVTSVDGMEVTGASLAAGTRVGFFAPGCPPCQELLPHFVASARDHTGVVLAFVAEGEGQEQYVAELAPVATVVAGDQAKAAVEAFGVKGYPTLCEVGDGGAINELAADPHALRDVVHA